MGLPQMSINEPEEVRIRIVVTERFYWVTFMKSTSLFISMSKMISAHPRFNIWDTILVLKIQAKLLTTSLCPSGHELVPEDKILGTWPECGELRNH